MRPKDIGTTFESAVVAYLRNNGFPQAERRALAGSADLGDVIGCPGLVIECKGGKAAENASDGQVEAWLAETERERINARADIGVLVMKRKAIGAGNAGRWWAVMPMWAFTTLACGDDDYNPSAALRLNLADLVVQLRGRGYGTPLTGAVDLAIAYRTGRYCDGMS